ncbi:exopolysaccharide biosynthesis polyprenyl glycosylphosphotransferase [Aquisphaera insulae]|uniref:exopolysaccharide biosynthesis polyprenyl glycosylphosphotransferase n=1 Tax=Aquisphaera insulae TaxID=2712864 RepID=UPI0013EDD7FD|nr:exopolysaccharide biosynthesis polyprenyl glycosylphosphotransferase [Aquisphaera insulae]
MNPPTSSPNPGTEPVKPVAIIRDEVPLPTPPRPQIAGPLRRELPLRIKRLIDYVGAAAGLLVVAPVMLAVALLIRLESPGPVLFRQLRRGHRGRLFWVLKFRTMVVDAEQRLKELEKRNESAGGVLFKMRDDPRVTRLGRLLRKYSLDELPQFFNVLRGEMSLVGPRPLQVRDSDILESLNAEGYIRRLAVVPGLTGPWQIGGRSDVNHEHMVRLDLDYIENWSLWRDIRIIFQTIRVVIAGRGAY